MAPRTPPSMDGQELQEGFQHLVQHNTANPLQGDPYMYENDSYLPGPTASYTPPEPEGRWYEDQFGKRHWGFQLSGSPANQRDQLARLDRNPNHGSPYQSHTVPQHQHQYPNPAYYSVSPPQTNSDQSPPLKRVTRQSRLAANNDSRHSSPRPRRQATRNAKQKTLSGPLSELTKDMDHIPIKDTEAHVSRSVEERRKEAERDHFIKRPSNSFILYRSAYAERARAFQKSANHQVVSSLAGESWAMEPPEVRKQYDAWAKRERDQHAAAFPDYKFQPQQNKGPGRKRKGRDDDSEEEESDLESEYGYNPRSSGRQLKSKKGKHTYRESSITPSAASLDEYDMLALEPADVYNPSSYHMINHPPPLPSNQIVGNHYHPSTSHPNQSFTDLGYGDGDSIRPEENAFDYHQPGAPVIGIPGAYHHELQGGDGGQSMLNHVDPMLGNYDQMHHGLSLGNGNMPQAQEIQPGLQSASFLTGHFSPVLNDFDGEHGELNDFGSDEWWNQNKDR